MAKRLLLTAAIGLALGTAAFAQTAADPSRTETAPAAVPASTTPSAGLAEPDRTRIAESVAKMTVKPLRGVDFSVSVGSRVPRELRVYRLPADVVQIVPQYRDYRFLVVEKNIVIVEPSANKIVAILPRDPAITTATAPTPSPTTTVSTAAPPATVTPATTTAVPAAATPPAATPPAAAPTVAAPASPAPSTTPTAVTPAKPTAATTSPSTASAPAPSTSSAPTSEQPSAQNSQASAEPDLPKVKKQASRSHKTSRAGRDDPRRARAEVRIGQRVPDDVPLYELPPSLYRALPAPEYRYSQRGARSYVAGPRSRIYYEYD